MNNEVGPNSESHAPDDRRLHFQVIDLVLLVGWVAVLCVMVKPLVDRIEFRSQLILVGGIAIQMVVFLGSMFYYLQLRKKTLGRAGVWLGMTANSTASGYIAGALLGLAFVSVIMIALARIMMALASISLIGLAFYFVVVLLPAVLGKGFAQFRVGHRFGVIEFFQHGVVVNSFAFYSWDDAKVTSWRREPKRLVVVLRLPKDSEQERLYDVAVSDTLRNFLREQGRLLERLPRGRSV
ncbi:hypothetical protein [Blastopirellula marina]|uniref:Uncharacterized protein n=1 Tax=Blastopirellula marina TaxID=124 RepID=A0A2S8GE07_9BACT|nr:hypothetical protein [Blastopirellula marina]PQO42686.1 hypothetical protein C5Y98_00600 [Blastopirellula marina]PTL46452.1 hypothetical protein C5Y97_00600 [Blastopirellula marina]